MKSEDKRAPRNQTLSLSEQELAHYLSVVEPVSGIGVNSSIGEIRNRIFCGDIKEAIQRLDDRVIDLLFIDPPYNLTKDYGEVRFTEQTSETYELWMNSWFEPLVKKLKPGASVYICCDWKSSNSVYKILSKHLVVKNRITWEREKGRGAKSNWKNCAEDIWFGTCSKDNFTFNTDAVKLRRKVIAPYTTKDGSPKDWQKSKLGNTRLTHPSNIWTDISIPFWSMPENTDHPTQKPEKLLAKLILASSNPGDLVFDPFMGSGTTAVVAKKLGREYCGVEINPEYCAWALKRLEQANSNSEIQGYRDGIFWERNSNLTH